MNSDAGPGPAGIDAGPAAGAPFRCQCLSYRFQVSADNPKQHNALLAALGPFRSTGDVQATYRLADRGRGALEDGRYAVLVNGAEMRWSDEPGVVIDWLLWHVHYEASTRAHDKVVIHAGSVVAPGGGALLMPGPSGSGKSTMTLALLRAGFGYLSDEFAIAEPDSGLITPYARHIALKPGTRRMFPELDASAVITPATAGETAHIPASVVRDDVSAEPDYARWVVFLRFSPDAGTTLTPLSRPRTLMGLVSNSVAFRLHPQQALETLAAISRTVTGWELTVSQVDDGVRVLADLVREEH